MNAANPEHASFPEAIDAFRKPFATVFERLLPSPDAPEGRLYEAMRYAALGDGKRLRPYIVYASAGMFETPDRFRFRVGAALEMVHAYSLVHDDLPAMDDDDIAGDGRPAMSSTTMPPRSSSETRSRRWLSKSCRRRKHTPIPASVVPWLADSQEPPEVVDWSEDRSLTSRAEARPL